jgi:hypothetical protein
MKITRNEDGTTTHLAPQGYGFRKGRGLMLVRLRDKTEQIRDAIFSQLSRCGWPTHKLKVRAFGDPPVFYVNIGYLRGLDPDALFSLLVGTYERKGETLKLCPDKCGHKRVLEVISKLPERVVVIGVGT